MRFSAAATLFLAFASSLLVAQTPAATPPAPAAEPAATSGSSMARAAAAPGSPPRITDTDIGFSYSLPAEWETLASKATTPDVPYPQVEAPKKGNVCTQVELTARQGQPPSVVVVVVLPFGCYGQPLASKNLADFAAGAEEGLKQTFEVAEPVVSNYSLGGHSMWLERAQGAVKGESDAKYVLEIACTVLDKGAVCWMALAADAAHLQTFEQRAVTLEGDAFEAIVPVSAIKAASPARK